MVALPEQQEGMVRFFPVRVIEVLRFSMLTALDSIKEHHNGNSCLGDDEQTPSVDMHGAKEVVSRKEEKAKSTHNKGKSPVVVAGTLRTKKQPAADSSIFDSPAYKETYQPTTLGSDHHTAIVLSAPNELNSSQAATSGPSLSRPKVSARLNRMVFSPKPPDVSNPKKGLQVNSLTKFKVSKPKSKDSLGSPSNELSKALSAALGNPMDSDDDAVFGEATESPFDINYVSDKFEKDL